MSHRYATGILCLLLSVATGASAYFVPPADGLVTDSVGILSDIEEASLEEMLEEIRDITGIEAVAVIVPSLDKSDGPEASVTIGNRWKIGTGYKGAMILLVSYWDQEIFLTTNEGASSSISEPVLKNLLNGIIIPRVNANGLYEGLRAGIQTIHDELITDTAAATTEPSMPFAITLVVDLLFAGSIVVLTIIFFVSLWSGLLSLATTKTWWMGAAVGLILGIVAMVAGAPRSSVLVLTVLGTVADAALSYGYTNNKKVHAWVYARLESTNALNENKKSAIRPRKK